MMTPQSYKPLGKTTIINPFAKARLRTFIIITIIFSFFSCNSALKKEYKKLKGSSITIPQNLSIIYFNDSLTNPLEETKYKIICYKEQIPCYECYIESLLFWNRLINKYSNTNTKFLFISTPQSKLASNKITPIPNFKYPIIIDTCNSFKQINSQITNNDLFHTFLLKNDTVYCIGDPINNKNIEVLYDKIIFNNF